MRFQGFLYPDEHVSPSMTLTQMEEKMRNDVEKVTYGLMSRLNQLSYGQILFDQRSQLRDDLQKLSDSLYQEIHPIYLKRPTHKRFEFIKQYPIFVQHILEAENKEKKELNVA